MLHGFVRWPIAGRQRNPAETVGNMTFANILNHPPKGPFRNRPDKFQEDGTAKKGTANDRELERGEVG
jgi:hypothetical protein